MASEVWEGMAPAKVNLALHVHGKRADGYHDLSSIVVFCAFGDILRIEDAKADRVEFTGEFASGLDQGENSLLRTLEFLRSHYALRGCYHVAVEKRIPTQAGLGGGTADAAALIKALVCYENLQSPDYDALAQLGADVPVSYSGAPALMTGIGENIHPIDLQNDFALLLANPRIALSTGDVFRGLKNYEAPIEAKPQYDFAEICALKNTLEPVAIRLAPEIGELQTALEKKGAKLVRMSGSGATVFGIFADLAQARVAASELARGYPNYWFWPTHTMRSTT